MQIRMVQSQSGIVKECPTGFSWTSLFFGFFVPLFRGWLGYSAVMFCVSVVTFGLSSFVFPFIINKAFVKHLLERGYMPASPTDAQAILAIGIHLMDVQQIHQNKVPQPQSPVPETSEKENSSQKVA